MRNPGLLRGLSGNRLRDTRATHMVGNRSPNFGQKRCPSSEVNPYGTVSSPHKVCTLRYHRTSFHEPSSRLALSHTNTSRVPFADVPTVDELLEAFFAPRHQRHEVRLAQEQGLSLTGPDGLLKKLTSPSRQQRAWSVVAVDGLLAGHAFENSRGFNQDVHRPGA